MKSPRNRLKNQEAFPMESSKKIEGSFERKSLDLWKKSRREDLLKKGTNLRKKRSFPSTQTSKA
jgi:hypothetical protein